MKLRISAAARVDLLAIAEYTTEEWGAPQTQAYFAQIRATFLDLAAGRTVPLGRDEVRDVNRGIGGPCRVNVQQFFHDGLEHWPSTTSKPHTECP